MAEFGKRPCRFVREPDSTNLDFVWGSLRIIYITHYDTIYN